jgi:DNA-binding transcriptional LysR family regulator
MANINFDIQQLQAFIAVADKGSFRAAAEAIHISAPAISRRIEKLESLIGIRLFNRTTRDVELTGLGRVFLERARCAIDDLEAAMLGISDIAATRSGRVSVACVPSAALYFLPNVISSFARRFPAIRIRVIDGGMGETLQSVLSGEADFGIGFISSHVSGIRFDPIHSDSFVVAMQRQHRMAKKKHISWNEIQAEKLIGVARSSGNRQLIDEVLLQAGLQVEYAFEVSHLGTLLGMVEAGLGMAVVPRMALPVGHATMVGVPLNNPVISRHLGLLTRQGSGLRPAAAIFHEYLFEDIRRRELLTAV